MDALPEPVLSISEQAKKMRAQRPRKVTFFISSSLCKSGELARISLYDGIHNFMALSETLIKKINRRFEPSGWVSLKFGSKDISLQTDEEGNAVKMFIGKRNEEGLIKGERYACNIIKDRDGKIIKDHWDRKGWAS